MIEGRAYLLDAIIWRFYGDMSSPRPGSSPASLRAGATISESFWQPGSSVGVSTGQPQVSVPMPHDGVEATVGIDGLSWFDLCVHMAMGTVEGGREVFVGTNYLAYASDAERLAACTAIAGFGCPCCAAPLATEGVSFARDAPGPFDMPTETGLLGGTLRCGECDVAMPVLHWVAAGVEGKTPLTAASEVFNLRLAGVEILFPFRGSEMGADSPFLQVLLAIGLSSVQREAAARLHPFREWVAAVDAHLLAYDIPEECQWDTTTELQDRGMEFLAPGGIFGEPGDSNARRVMDYAGSVAATELCGLHTSVMNAVALHLHLVCASKTLPPASQADRARIARAIKAAMAAHGGQVIFCPVTRRLQRVVRMFWQPRVDELGGDVSCMEMSVEESVDEWNITCTRIPLFDHDCYDVTMRDWADMERVSETSPEMHHYNEVVLAVAADEHPRSSRCTAGVAAATELVALHRLANGSPGGVAGDAQRLAQRVRSAPSKAQSPAHARLRREHGADGMHSTQRMELRRNDGREHVPADESSPGAVRPKGAVQRARAAATELAVRAMRTESRVDHMTLATKRAMSPAQQLLASGARAAAAAKQVLRAAATAASRKRSGMTTGYTPPRVDPQSRDASRRGHAKFVVVQQGDEYQPQRPPGSRERTGSSQEPWLCSPGSPWHSPDGGGTGAALAHQRLIASLADAPGRGMVLVEVLVRLAGPPNSGDLNPPTCEHVVPVHDGDNVVTLANNLCSEYGGWHNHCFEHGWHCGPGLAVARQLHKALTIAYMLADESRRTRQEVGGTGRHQDRLRVAVKAAVAAIRAFEKLTADLEVVPVQTAPLSDSGAGGSGACGSGAAGGDGDGGGGKEEERDAGGAGERGGDSSGGCGRGGGPRARPFLVPAVSAGVPQPGGGAPPHVLCG
jgi:hypothetical protein